MKNRGIVRRVDDLGRIVIPKEMRKELGVADGDPVEMLMTDDGMFVRPHPRASEIASYLRNLKKAVSDDVNLEKKEHEALLEKINEFEVMLKKFQRSTQQGNPQ